MPLKFIGGVIAAIGMLIIFTHTLGIKVEEAAFKRLFYGILLVIIGLLFIFYSHI